MRILRHLLAILLLPFVMVVVVPRWIVLGEAASDTRWRAGTAAWTGHAAGALLFLAGFALFAWCVSLFARVGRGTLAPWDPTQRLVAVGPYRYMRNPMITGVLAMIFGEALFLGSRAVVTPLGGFRTVLISTEETMRRVRYNVAASLDGFIAGPNGEYDWIPNDPTIDFKALFAAFDTVLLGRRSYEAAQGGPSFGKKMRVYVFSRTLRPEDHPGVTVVNDDAAGVVAALRAEPGDKDIWLFGGGDLFRSLLDAGQVDSVEVTVAPVLLGAGLPLITPGGPARLTLTGTKTYPSGMVTLTYSATG